MNKLEAITICVGEKSSRFLDYTLYFNKKFFDNFIVVTSVGDYETLKICKKHSIECVQTDRFYYDGAKFRKGSGYNVGMENIKHNDGICFIDCDTVIPNSFSKLRKDFNWDKEVFYGARRVIVPKVSDVLDDKKSESDFWIPYGIGYGYFGIFNCKSQVIQNNGFYYSENDGVGESDWMFRNQWGDCINDLKEYTGLLKELPIKVYHLGMPGGTENIDFWKN